MAYGLEIYNDGGFLQLSDSVANYFLVDSGSAIVPQVAFIDTAPYLGTSITITSSTSFDAIAVQTTDRFVIPKAIFDTSTTSTNLTFSQSLTEGTVRYWLFKRYSSLLPSTSGYGMEIYGSGGSVAFSSHYPKLMKSHSIIPVTNLTGTQNFSLPSDRMFAFLSYGTVYNSAVSPTKASPDVKVPQAIQTYSGGVSVKSSNARSGRINSSVGVYSGGLVAIDVTNY